jgi:thiol:disulfide interchange protein
LASLLFKLSNPNTMKKFLAILLLSAFVMTATAQNKSVQFAYSAVRTSDSVVLFKAKANISKGLQLFSANKRSEEDAFISAINFDSSLKKYRNATDSITEKGTMIVVNGELNYRAFADSVEFVVPLHIAATDSIKTIKGDIAWLGKKGDEFPSDGENFDVKINNEATVITNVNSTTNEPKKYGSILSVFLAGLGAGILALIFPCIYALIPVTVSFFLKRSKTKQQGVKNAFIYSLSIIIIFAIIGFIFGLTRNAGFANDFASSAAFNIFVFALFLVFGISFLGAFEITLPSSWTNSIDSKADNKSVIGIFFMALTLVVVSFSCTAPFISYFAVTPGLSIAERTIAFGGFGLGIALPFTLFALSPSLLNKLAKGGGWLNSLKVVFGFIELAFALKFLSSADLAYHWRLLDREVYLALWIVIFGLLGLYLLGKLKLSHDDELPKNDYGQPYLTVTRLFFAIAALSFTVYMIPGLWGAPLKGISAWLPEEHTQDFNLYKSSNHTQGGSAVSNTSSAAIRPVKYTDILGSEIPGVESYFDYDEAIAAAKATKKPLMIDFTGHSCANCRKMEKEVLSDPAVMSTLQKDFIVVSLYVDDKYPLPESEWKKSFTDSTNILKRMGDKNLDFEVELSNNNAQPFYLFVGNDGKLLLPNGYGYESNIPKFLAHLEAVKTAFNKTNQ